MGILVPGEYKMLSIITCAACKITKGKIYTVIVKNNGEWMGQHNTVSIANIKYHYPKGFIVHPFYKCEYDILGEEI
jgi:hypothetical protein